MNVFDGLPFLSFLFLAVILIARILNLWKKGIQISSKNGKKRTLNKFLFLVFGFIFLIWLFEITKPAIHLSFSILPKVITKLLIQSNFMKISGATILLLSLILWTVTIKHFKTSLRFGLDENNRGKLITTGIFSISRNPFFLSFDFYFLGIALFQPNLFFIGFAVLSIVSIHFFILKEEKFLQKVYGEEYKNYVRKVRRYI